MKIKLSSLLLVSIFTISSCSSKITVPEEIGTVMFNILTELQSIDKEEYFSYLATVETFNKLGENVCDDEFKETLKSATSEVIQEEYGRELNELKEAGIKNNITWSDIEFLDYIYETEDIACIRGISGKVYFKHKGKTYTVNVDSFYSEDRYHLGGAENLKVFDN